MFQTIFNNRESLYYSEKNKTNYLIVGYFGLTNISLAYELAKAYSSNYDIPIETVRMETILKSSRYKSMVMIYSTIEDQKPYYGANKIDDFIKFIQE